MNPVVRNILAVLAGVVAGAIVNMALVIGVVFLAGGVANSFMLPGPTWFNVLDMVGAYIPMAWLGAWLGTKKARTA